ncbi:MAG: extracellular solute-binding protein [Alphaproteobacteria bacterium]
MQRWLTAMLTWMAVGGLLATGAHANIELKVARFFDPCIEGNIRIEQASGEACIIQALLHAFSAEDNGITIDLLPPNRDNYYPKLITAYAEGRPPDVHLLHHHRLPDFASAGLLAPLDDDLAAAGVDVADWEDAARDAATFNGRIVALPFDLHANLWHVNPALMKEAGLIGRDGRPLLPRSPGELLEHAKIVKETTGKDYLAADFMQYPIGVRAVLSLLWQQGANIFDGDRAMVNTPEMRAAITSFTDLFDAGYANPRDDYETAQQAFLDGEVAVLINGTWAVDLYDREVSRGDIALTEYDVADFPTLFERPATWADSHLWAVPETLRTQKPEAFKAAMQLLAWIDAHSLDWARTGHLAARRSVLESDAYATLPHRLDYRRSVEIGDDLPATSGYDDIHEVMAACMRSIWADHVPLDTALARAEAEIKHLLPQSLSTTEVAAGR